MTTAGQDGDATPTLPGSQAVGDGWSLQIRPRDQDGVEARLDPGDSHPVLVKQITRDPCRIVRAISADSMGRSPPLTVRARCEPGLVDWVAVSSLKPDGGLKRLVRGDVSPGASPDDFVAHLEGCDLEPSSSAFLVLQLAADRQGRLEGLRVEARADGVPATGGAAGPRPRASPFRILFDPDFYAGQAGEALGLEEPFAHYRRTRGLLGFDPHPLFDTRWYLSRLPAPLAKRESPLAHYWRTGDRLGLSPHPLFDPVWYRGQPPVLTEDENALLHFLRNGQHDPRRPHPTFAPDLYTEQTPGILISGLNPLTAWLATGQQQAPGSPGRAAPPEEPDARIVVYTCLFGATEALKDIAAPDPAVRYIAFTNRPDLTSDVWEIVRITDGLADGRRSSRLPKILAHLYLPAHDVAIYVDASFEISSTDIRAAVEEGLEGRDLGLYRHHKRRCVYDELDLCISYNIENAENHAAYLSTYERMGIGRKAGLFENGIMFRRNTPQVASLNEHWWRLHRGSRDQLSFMPALIGSGVRVNPIRHGDQVRRNAHFRHVRHERTPLPSPGKLHAFVIPEAGFEAFLSGPACRAIMAVLGPADCALFLQQGYALSPSNWASLALALAGEGSDGLIVGRSDTARAPFQRLPDLVRSPSPRRFRALADSIADIERDWQVDVTGLDASLGPVLLVSVHAWRSLRLGDDDPLRKMAELPVRLALSLAACSDGLALPADAGKSGGRPVLTCIVNDGAGLTQRRYSDLLASAFDLRFTGDGLDGVGPANAVSDDADADARQDFAEALAGARRLVCCTSGGGLALTEAEALVTALRQAGHAVTWLVPDSEAAPDRAWAVYPAGYADEAGLAAAIALQDARFPIDLILVTGDRTPPRALREAADGLSIPVRSWSELSAGDGGGDGPRSVEPVLEAVKRFRFVDRPGDRPRAGLGGLAGVLQSPTPSGK